MRVYGHAVHWCTDRERKIDYRIAPGGVYDMPASLATAVAETYPDRVCVIGDNETAEEHKGACDKPDQHSTVTTWNTMSGEPNEDRQVRVTSGGPGRDRTGRFLPSKARQT